MEEESHSWLEEVDLRVEGDRVLLQATDNSGDPIEAYGDELITTFADQLASAARQASDAVGLGLLIEKPFDESAVFRIDDVTAWYHIPGVTMLKAGTKEGPAQLTAVQALELSDFLERGAGGQVLLRVDVGHDLIGFLD